MVLYNSKKSDPSFSLYLSNNLHLHGAHAHLIMIPNVMMKKSFDILNGIGVTLAE